MTIQIRQQYGISIVELNGRIVGSASSELREIILAEIETYDEPRMLINFEKVHRIDSIGLGVLVEAHVASTKRKGRIGIVHLGEHIKDSIVANRLVHLFEFFDSEDEAVSALSA